MLSRELNDKIETLSKQLHDLENVHRSEKSRMEDR